MGSLGWPELLAIFVIALIVFGPRKLPQLGKTLGRTLGEFRRATNELKSSLEVEISKEEEKSTRAERQRIEDTYARRREKEQGEPPEAGKPETAPPSKNSDPYTGAAARDAEASESEAAADEAAGESGDPGEPDQAAGETDDKAGKTSPP